MKKAGKCVAPPHRKTTHRLKSCTFWVAVGSFFHQDIAGANGFHFTGRVKHRTLAPDSYRLRAVERLDGLASNRVQADFRVKKR